MTDRNRFGLRHQPPSTVRRTVRQRCGFGCVICGFAFYDFEHFEPDFADAEQHLAEGITLLCMQCNQKRARGRLSRETVARANATPKCHEQGFANEFFDYGNRWMEVAIGGASFIECQNAIEINGFPILSVQPPTEEGQPFLVSGMFADKMGDITMRIKDNELSVGADNWDVEWQGPRVTIRSGPGDVSLVMRTEPQHRLVVERINMSFEGASIRGDESILQVSADGRGWNTFQAMSARSCRTGISLTNR